MKLFFKPYILELKHTFTLASSSRKTTPVILTEIEHDGLKGYGEAAMPPYLGENIETASSFLGRVDLTNFKDPFELEKILKYVDSISKGNFAAKASVDIALHDLVGKILNKPWYSLWGLDKDKIYYTSFTTGIDSPSVIKAKVNEAKDFKILKVKLGKDNDKEIIETIRSITNKPIYVDVNQGWKNKESALDLIFWLKEKNVELVEQPFPKEMIKETTWLTERSPLPIIADESVQTSLDILKVCSAFSGINIKLMKCGGLREAHKMLLLAKSLGMKVMIGCMTETSCAISAAAQLAPMADYIDLDGNLLINNDPFVGVKVLDGQIQLNNEPGIGLLSR